MKLSVKVPHALCGPAQRPSAAVLVRRFLQYEARFRTSLLVFLSGRSESMEVAYGK